VPAYPPPGSFGAPTAEQPPAAPPPGAFGAPPQAGGGGGKSNRGLLIAIGAVVVVLLGIGAFVVFSGGDDNTSTTGTTTGSGGTGSAAGAISSVDDAKTGVVQIVAKGSFVDPEVGEVQEGAGAGSGFIIDPAGIAVTNNHVVTGAATLEVYVGGSDEPKNAKVIATSECSDLAVIDIDGDGYPFFDFYSGATDPGLDVYLAGFPLGDPEYSLTKGIVVKAPRAEATNWASVDAVLEHDAESNPGNSGGPLLTEDGKVVGVHYAGAAETDQAFAIASPVLEDVVSDLEAGTPVDYIGINGQAVANEDGSLTGVWVSAVESGSPAERIGIEGGDIITKMEGLSLGSDGTMADYCDILRTKGSDAPLAVEVLRFPTQEVLRGTLNEDEELALAFSFADAIESDPQTDPGGPTTYSDYTVVADDSGQLQMEVPVEWSDVNGTAFTFDDGTTTPSLTAAPDLDAFNNSYSASGAYLLLFDDPAAASDPAGSLSTVISSFGADTACPTVEVDAEPYDDSVYTGAYSVLGDCDGTSAQAVFVVAVPPDESYAIVVLVQVTNEADLEALDHVFQSFQVIR
jgi:serine protease Do